MAKIRAHIGCVDSNRLSHKKVIVLAVLQQQNGAYNWCLLYVVGRDLTRVSNLSWLLVHMMSLSFYKFEFLQGGTASVVMLQNLTPLIQLANQLSRIDIQLTSNRYTHLQIKLLSLFCFSKLTNVCLWASSVCNNHHRHR